jgi:hypothetical protein
MQILEMPGNNDAASAGGDQLPRPRSLSVAMATEAHARDPTPGGRSAQLSHGADHQMR